MEVGGNSTVDCGSCTEYVLLFKLLPFSGSGGIQVKLGWLWTVNLEPINYLKRARLIQLTDFFRYP